MTDLSFLQTNFYKQHAHILAESFYKFTKKNLIDKQQGDINIENLYNAPFAILSHGIEKVPIFNFGNKVVLELFEYKWDNFIKIPSHKSAEPIERKEREMFLQKVSSKGFVNNYSGIRISSSGKRFFIKNAFVWNLYKNDQYYGQAAKFDNWQFL